MGLATRSVGVPLVVPLPVPAAPGWSLGYGPRILRDVGASSAGRAAAGHGAGPLGDSRSAGFAPGQLGVVASRSVGFASGGA